jgi:hypothetical protein
MDADGERVDHFNRWYDEAHMAGAPDVPGFRGEHRRFRNINSAADARGVPAGPEFTALYEIEPDADIQSAIDSEEFRAWSGDYVQNWSAHTSNLSAVLCDQMSGSDGHLDHRRVLIEQLTPATQDSDFEPWYMQHHLQQLGEIDGVGSDIRAYRAFALKSKNWEYRDEPRYTVICELTDPDSVVGSASFVRWVDEVKKAPSGGDAKATWSVCTRIY